VDQLIGSEFVAMALGIDGIMPSRQRARRPNSGIADGSQSLASAYADLARLGLVTRTWIVISSTSLRRGVSAPPFLGGSTDCPLPKFRHRSNDADLQTNTPRAAHERIAAADDVHRRTMINGIGPAFPRRIGG
jgi:hypothetical protein